MSPTSCQTAPPRICRGRILQIWQIDYNPDLPKLRGAVYLPRFARQKPFHSHLPVAGIAGIPIRHAAIRLDAQVVEALVKMAHGLDPRVPPRQGRPVRQGPVPAIPELDFPGPAPLAAEAALVYEAVVLATQLHEVIQAGLAAVAPVLYVVGVHEMPSGAARKAASIVAKP